MIFLCSEIVRGKVTSNSCVLWIYLPISSTLAIHLVITESIQLVFYKDVDTNVTTNPNPYDKWLAP